MPVYEVHLFKCIVFHNSILFHDGIVRVLADAVLYLFSLVNKTTMIANGASPDEMLSLTSYLDLQCFYYVHTML